MSLTLTDGPSLQAFAESIRSVYPILADLERPSVRIVSDGKFSVLVIGFEQKLLELRVLLFQSDKRDSPQLVQVNLYAQLISGSMRELHDTAIYSELKPVFAGTEVLVLDDHSFAEFMRHYDSLSDTLQGVLDGALWNQPQPPKLKRFAA